MISAASNSILRHDEAEQVEYVVATILTMFLNTSDIGRTILLSS